VFEKPRVFAFGAASPVAPASLSILAASPTTENGAPRPTEKGTNPAAKPPEALPSRTGKGMHPRERVIRLEEAGAYREEGSNTAIA
jgi:hypothetical protein